MDQKQKPKAVIVGGSIAGVSCAHALISAGWDVVVIEKSCAPPKGSPTGAGLGIDTQAQQIIQSWLPQPELLLQATLPLTIDLNQAMDGETKVSRVLTRDENFNFRAGHWGDIHGLLYTALPQHIFLWGHLFLSFSISEDKTSVAIKAKVLQTDEIIDVKGDLLIAADGCLSSIRWAFLPDLKLRYSGFCAWRGVFDFSGEENSETMLGIRKVFPELGKCQYINLNGGSHTILYELLHKRLNWIWYISQPEPELKGNSVTKKVETNMIENMYKEAEKVLFPEFVRLIKETKEPFLNFIYDCPPLERTYWDNIVLVGDAAHPVTPNGARSTNMSIVDAVVLGKCLEKWGAENLPSALAEYQSIRLPVTSKQVLKSWRMGMIRQGLPLPDREPFDPKTASTEDCYEEVPHKNMPFFSGAPLSVDRCCMAPVQEVSSVKCSQLFRV